VQREVVKPGGIAALELELDFADRFDRVAANHVDLAFDDRGLDMRPRYRLDLDGGARDVGNENRAEFAGNIFRQLSAALRRLGVGAVIEERILPLAAREDVRPTEITGLDCLNETAGLLADTKGQSSLLQREIIRVV
jgi:hypothetical protein